jgi:hypothetical protein
MRLQPKSLIEQAAQHPNCRLGERPSRGIWYSGSRGHDRKRPFRPAVKREGRKCEESPCLLGETRSRYRIAMTDDQARATPLHLESQDVLCIPTKDEG